MTDQINESSKVKPPTQGVGVSGFRADVYANDEQKMDYRWGDLIHLPPFQMFAAETFNRGHGDVFEWIKGFVTDQVNTIGQEALFKKYSDWHSAKGYWKAEDVYGALIANKDV